jgi:hypothetical protein
MNRKRKQQARPDLAGSGGHVGDAPDELTAPQAKAIEALLQEPTLTRAAAASGVNERTLRRWLAEGPFKAALLTARREAFGQAIGLTQKYAPVAVATLVKVMNDASTSASAKVTAAGVLLKFGREGIELDDLAERVEMLERTAKGEATSPALTRRARTNGDASATDHEEVGV